MAREEEEGEHAVEEERCYKLGRFMDALRSYAGGLSCIVKNKLRNDYDDNGNNNNDHDKWDAGSGDERRRQPSLLPILQSHPSSS